VLAAFNTGNVEVLALTKTSGDIGYTHSSRAIKKWVCTVGFIEATITRAGTEQTSFPPVES
jgi:hypothetical protein